MAGTAWPPAPGTPAPGSTGGAGDGLTVDLTLGSATSGALSLSNVRTTALVTSDTVSLDPVAFSLFEGRYEGAMHVTLAETPRYRWRGTVSGVDTAKLMAFAGAANSISGRLSGTVSLDGAGLEVEGAGPRIADAR